MKKAIMSLAVYFPTLVLLAGVVIVLIGIATLDQGTILLGVLAFLAAYMLMPLMMGIAEWTDSDRQSSRPRSPDSENPEN